VAGGGRAGCLTSDDFRAGLADASGLVIDGWVEDQFADDLAGGGVDDADVEAVNQHQDGGSGVGSADADVVQSAFVAEADFAVAVDYLAADPGCGCSPACLAGWLLGRPGRQPTGCPVERVVRPAACSGC
jgi:hypothetical protein